LLKTLEDHCSHPIDADRLSVILFTTDASKLLATLRSRCYAWRLRQLPRGAFEAVLTSAGAAPVQIDKLPDPYPGSVDEAIHEVRTDRGAIDQLLSSMATRNPINAIKATEGFSRQQAIMLAILIRRHLVGSSKLGMLTMSRLDPAALSAWSAVLCDPTIPAQASARWGFLLAFSRA
jgi:hypothetical protein